MPILDYVLPCKFERVFLFLLHTISRCTCYSNQLNLVLLVTVNCDLALAWWVSDQHLCFTARRSRLLYLDRLGISGWTVWTSCVIFLQMLRFHPSTQNELNRFHPDWSYGDRDKYILLLTYWGVVLYFHSKHRNNLTWELSCIFLCYNLWETKHQGMFTLSYFHILKCHVKI